MGIGLSENISMNEFLDSLDDRELTPAIYDAFIKAWPKIHGYRGGGGQ